MKQVTSIVFIALLTLTMHSANALDLEGAWQSAQLHDPEFLAAQSAYEADKTHRDQSRGIWLPSVSLTAGAGKQSSNSEIAGAQFSAPGFNQSSGAAFNTSIRHGDLEQYAIVVRQPVLNRQLLTQSRQLSLSADMADIEWKNARQDLLLRVTEHYFNVLIASESLRLLRQQQEAVEFTLNQVKDSFQLGSIPVTDTYEAVARAETIKAQIMAAEMDLQVKKAIFSDLTGIQMQELDVLSLPSDIKHPLNFPSLENYLSDVSLNNPLILIQGKKLAIAKEEAAKHSALATPQIDVVAQASYDRLHGAGDFGHAENAGNNRMIGIQLTIPLFTGGVRTSKHKESLHLVDKTKSDGELLRQKILVKARTSWLGITVGIGRITALVQAHKANLARLDATRLGHSVGDRTTLELLNAENEATSSELALLQAQISVVSDRLRLAQLSGNLNENTIHPVNTLLIQRTAKP